MKAILDVAEHQLTASGPSGLSIDAIASALGLTRGAVLRCFRSEDAVVAALIRRDLRELTEATRALPAVSPLTVPEAVTSLISLTANQWQRHGAVMKAAVDLAPSVPEIAGLWDVGRETLAQAAQRIALTAPLPDRVDYDGSFALARALIALTEHIFYQSFTSGIPLQDASRALAESWMRALGREEPRIGQPDTDRTTKDTR